MQKLKNRTTSVYSTTRPGGRLWSGAEPSICWVVSMLLLPPADAAVLHALRRFRPHRHCLDCRVLSARSTVVPGAAPAAPIHLAALRRSRFAWPDSRSCPKNRRVALL